MAFNPSVILSLSSIVNVYMLNQLQEACVE